MKWIVKIQQTKQQRAVEAMNNFQLWMEKMNNIHLADVRRMSEAYQKVYQSNII